jgi:2-oxoglutarate dehydrogenase E2 component (dihydrolipoamide succinyltransferase)
MSIELRIPALGESITDVEIGAWLKGQGEAVRKDEPLVTLESEKATVELPAPDSGTLSRILKQKGEVAKVGEIIAYLDKGGQVEPARGPATGASKPAAPPAEERPRDGQPIVMPAAQRVLAEHGVRAQEVTPTGPGGRVLKEDVVRHLEQSRPQPAAAPKVPAEQPTPQPAPPAPGPMSQAVVLSPALAGAAAAPGREEETVPMSRLRRTVAERLVEAQHTAALLTTFNEIDMSATVALRKEYGEAFHRKYSVKLGFMSFFVKACVDALKQFPVLNAEARGTNIVYHNYYDIGVAIGSAKGLVVPVLRNAEHLSFAQVELAVGDFARRARENKLKLDELQGGTFTISNGGVYGSMLSTPIVNPPQSGVLGMHAIQERPVARDGNVVIRPIMYIALTYDHRIVDGREAVSFLRHIREVIENPARMLMEI